MAFTLPALPYPAEALEPYIDTRTMEIHHGKHHQAYITNVNKALESAPELGQKRVDELLANNLAIVPDAIKTAVRRLRRRQGEILRAEIAQTVARGKDIEEEIRHLLAALG